MYIYIIKRCNDNWRFSIFHRFEIQRDMAIMVGILTAFEWQQE